MIAGRTLPPYDCHAGSVALASAKRTVPVVFASSVFVPVSSMPGWLQAFAKVSPVTLTTDTARSYALVGGLPSSLGGIPAGPRSYPPGHSARGQSLPQSREAPGPGLPFGPGRQMKFTA